MLISRVSNWKFLLSLAILYVLFSTILLKNAEEKINSLAGEEIGVIDLQIGFNPQKTLTMVESYGDRARDYYAFVEMTLDIAYPIIYTLMLTIILGLVYRKSKRWQFRLSPLLILVFDLIENLNIVILLKTFPSQNMAIAQLVEFFKLLKFLTLAIIVLIILWGLLKNLLQTKR